MFGYSGDSKWVIQRSLEEVLNYFCRNLDWGQVIPFEFENSFTNPKHKVLIKTALALIKQEVNCLIFVDLTGKRDKPKSYIKYALFFIDGIK